MKIERLLLLVLATIIFLYGLFYLATGVIALANISEYGFLPFLNGVIYFGILGFFVPVLLMFISDFYHPLVVDRTGLHSKLFGKSLDVNWEDIVSVRPVILFGVIKLRNKYFIVTKVALTILHRMYGVLFSNTRRSILPINPLIHDDPKIIEKIARQAKKNRELESDRGNAAYMQSSISRKK
jgi:hypothetical protein